MPEMSGDDDQWTGFHLLRKEVDGRGEQGNAVNRACTLACGTTATTLSDSEVCDNVLDQTHRIRQLEAANHWCHALSLF